VPNTNYSGVLVEEEIRSLQLIRAPELGREEEWREEERCYQPASYDLRLGAEYVMPRKDDQLVISRCDTSGLLTIEPFATSIVSTYEWVALPSNVVGRFNLRVQPTLEGLMVQMGTQVEPNYKGPLIALLHNISNRPINLKFRDFDTRPFTIEFSYTSQRSGPPAARKKLRKTFKDFIPPNYARGGMNLVIADIHRNIPIRLIQSISLNTRRTEFLVPSAGAMAE
jgi:deoxycytidine triphosphate deaminase